MCSVGLGYAWPGSDLDKAFIIIEGSSSPLKNKEIVNRYRGQLWENMDTRILSINHYAAFPNVYTKKQVMDNIDLFDSYTKDYTEFDKMIAYSAINYIKDPIKRAQFNLELSEKLPGYLKEDAKNFAYFIETLRECCYWTYDKAWDKELSEKIGLTYDVVKTNKFSDFGNIMRPFNQDEKTLMQMMITQGYDTFVNRCAEGRHMSKEAIEKIAEGRVWTGEAAKELGLVDVLGGIDTALEIAVRKAGIEGYTVVSYPAKQDLLSSLLNTKPTNYVESQILKSKLGEYYQQFGMLKNLKERSMIQARIPFELNIK